MKENSEFGQDASITGKIMKTRIGFISNSSSSSFTFCVPKNSTEEEILTIIEQQIGELKGFFLPEFRQSIIDTIMECKGEKADVDEELKDAQEYLKTSKYGKQEFIDWWQEKKDKNFDVYQGGFSDNGCGAIQAWLCDTPFKVEKEGFFMENSAGY